MIKEQGNEMEPSQTQHNAEKQVSKENNLKNRWGKDKEGKYEA